MMTNQFVGLDTLRDWLASQGFRLEEHRCRSKYNHCNWYAYRETVLPARKCEANAGKRIQITVKPYKYQDLINAERAEVELTGEAGGSWYKLMAYGLDLSGNAFQDKFASIEKNLIAAWNALIPQDTTNQG